MLRESAGLLTVLCAIVGLLALTGVSRAETYYFIAVYNPIPDDAEGEPNPSLGAILTAEVVSIESDSVPAPPDPAPGAPLVPFQQVTLEELQQMGYDAPEVVLDEARASGHASEEEMDGWGVVAYINAGLIGSYLKRVQPGAKVWRHWYNPGPMSQRYTCGTTQPRGLVDYDSGWMSRWGWGINRYRDYAYSRSHTWEWWSQCYGTNRWDPSYPTSTTTYRTW